MVTARKRKSARFSATRSRRRGSPRQDSVRDSLPASPVWVSRRTFPSCVVNKPGQPTSNRDCTGRQRGLGPDAGRARPVRGVVGSTACRPNPFGRLRLRSSRFVWVWRSSQRASADGNWRMRSRRRSKRILKAEFCLLIRSRHRRLAASPRSDAALVAPLRFATSRSQASSVFVRPPSLLAILDTSRAAAWCSSILGRPDPLQTPVLLSRIRSSTSAYRSSPSPVSLLPSRGGYENSREANAPSRRPGESVEHPGRAVLFSVAALPDSVGRRIGRHQGGQRLSALFRIDTLIHGRIGPIRVTGLPTTLSTVAAGRLDNVAPAGAVLKPQSRTVATGDTIFTAPAAWVVRLTEPTRVRRGRLSEQQS